MDLNNENPKKNITEEDIADIIKEVFKDVKSLSCDIKDLIKTGYFYRIGLKHVMVTGSGGALNYINVCRESGIPDEMIAEDIYITESKGMTTNMEWYCINTITWKNASETKETRERSND